MAYVDPRRRTTHQFSRQPSDNALFPLPFPPDIALEIIGSNSILALSICAAKYWLLARGVGSLWLSINVLAGGGIGALLWLVWRGKLVMRGAFPWKTLLVTSAALLAQQIALFYSLKRLDASRVIFWSPFSAILVNHILRTHSRRSISLALFGFISSVYLDSVLSKIDFSTAFKAYLGLVIHGVLQVATTHTTQHLSNSFETPKVAWVFTILSAAVSTIPIHLLGRTVGLLPPYPYVPLLALIPLPLLSFILLFYIPLLNTSTSTYSPRGTFKVGFGAVVVTSLLVSPLFSRPIALSDFIIGIIAFFSLRPSSKLGAGSGGTGAGSASEPTLRLLQGYLNTILSNPESKKIFYFLVVNMVYMLVQMLYGVWTNSLGLISDAIHMAFDCMAIAMGLFASVMATWTPNESFTYGYSRIETLSGFANGIFLILISVFIVVEAIQRLLDPPEMNTRQLLLVSTVGLGVNLFGMFAMGGHHHHGHSHSHSHSHGHDHSDDEHHDEHHSHDHDHNHFGHDHHGHSHDHSGPEDAHDHSHDHNHSSDHTHSHSHSHSHAHSHEEHDHSHSHSHSEAHESSGLLSPEINLGSPTTANSPLPYTPIIPTLSPYTPITPSYSFTHDIHLETHHPETAHSHSHNHTRSREGHSHNMRGVFLHVMADTLGSIGVIISTILINIYGWTGFDPIASLFIAILIAASVVPLVMDTGRVLALDLGGKEVDVERALQELSNVWGVSSYSDAKFWPLEQNRIVGSIHIQILPGIVALRGEAQNERDIGHSGLSKLDRVRDGVEHVLKSRIKGLEELIIQLDG